MSERKTLTAPAYASAFSCILDSTCPQTNGSRGCPMWLEYADELRDEDGLLIDEDRVGGCAPVVLYKISAETANRSVLAANTAGKARDAALGVGEILDQGRRAVRAAIDQRQRAELVDVERRAAATLQTNNGSADADRDEREPRQ